MKYLISIVIFFLSCSFLANSQSLDNSDIKQLIDRYKLDVRGPYKEIRWFCTDGSILPPQQRCPEPGGVQRATYKPEVISLGKTNHIFLGQILTTTPYSDFWDTENGFSRNKQYHLENYLRAIDNGWVLRKAQYYRGAFQSEDEENWGVRFLSWLVNDAETIKKHYFILRQTVKEIPHGSDNNLKQRIRSNSKLVSDNYSPFLDLRIKIHGQPDASDIGSVKAFKDKHALKMSSEDRVKMDELISDMEVQYKAFDVFSLNEHLASINTTLPIFQSLQDFKQNYAQTTTPTQRIVELSNNIMGIRKACILDQSPTSRLGLLDISLILEELLIREQSEFKSQSIKESLLNIKALGSAACGSGYLEMWEWDQLSKRLELANYNTLELSNLLDFFEASCSIAEWGTGMFISEYEDVVQTFSGFETKAEGFIDDRVRSSLLLSIGNSVNTLGKQISTYQESNSRLIDIEDTRSVRGLNPGIAKGELVVVSTPSEDMHFSADKIYIFHKPPADLKPVAGIATVTEGNIVSHVQLLARSLGIPNAVVSLQNLEALKKHAGKQVFYAVSSKGVVIIKPVDEMSSIEKALFEQKKRNELKFKVPVEKIRLENTSVLNLKDVNARFSGVICGPKAANMGQLKQMFPNQVVDGLVIPFGIFKQHMDQTMDGESLSYWDYLGRVFEKASKMQILGSSEEQIDAFVLFELDKFRKAISQINLNNDFILDLELNFKNVFGKELGQVPVFLRSDTNMEDLKDFSGAGLNLTLFNVVDRDMILQGIRNVWASPYAERSYKWRQRYLLNPENVFPSILIIPSVDVDYSGVVVSKGVHSGSKDEITVAFSRGAGGAVDGQKAESYLIRKNGEKTLLSPSRELSYKTLPESGGTYNTFTSFESPILNNTNLNQISGMVAQIKLLFPESMGLTTKGPYDIEMGFKNNKLWLFQVRPFVENKSKTGASYLESLNPKTPQNTKIELTIQISE